MGGMIAAFLIALTFSHSGKIFFDISQGLVAILAPPLSVVFLAGAFWKRTTDKAAEWVLYGGGALCVIIGICYILNYPSKGYWPNFLLLSFYLFAFLLIAIILISLCTRTTKGAMLSHEEAEKETSPGRVWIWWILIAIIMILIYIAFN
jgi:SSS family solute:Na+ symporter